MKVAVRYYSRGGNTKALAEAVAKALNVEAVSVDSDNAKIDEETDMLFIGGGLYAYGLDKRLKTYIKTLNPDKIKKAAVFSTSWISKHALDILKKSLSSQGISVIDDTLYAKNMPNDENLKEAKDFAKKAVQ